MGPNLLLSNNNIENCTTANDNPLISLTGVQVTRIVSNNFTGANPEGTLIVYRDTVRARHHLEDNKLYNSGKLETNGYVTRKDNFIAMKGVQ